jgi:phosphatidylglycerophosphate synthase
MLERKYLSQDNIINYKNYKYASEDNTFFTRIYNVAWKKMVLLIPNYIHPNLITLMGFLSVILGYLMRNFKYGHFYMGIATFLYMNFDALDGMHARRIKQTSVIGEYFDHLIDLCNAGLISISLMEQFGITSLLTKNILFLGFGLIFMIPHYEAIYTKKIIFKGVTDVSLYLTTTILIFILDIKLPNFDYKDLILRMLGMSLVLYGINWLYKINLNNLSHTNKVEFKLPLLILLYYLVKGICLIMKPNENLYLIGISDTLLLLEITNYKIFKTDPTNILVLFPIIYSVNPVISTVYSVYNVIQFIIGLSNQLDINLFKVREKKLKVFCCGVFESKTKSKAYCFSLVLFLPSTFSSNKTSAGSIRITTFLSIV